MSTMSIGLHFAELLRYARHRQTACSEVRTTQACLLVADLRIQHQQQASIKSNIREGYHQQRTGAQGQHTYQHEFESQQLYFDLNWQFRLGNVLQDPGRQLMQRVVTEVRNKIVARLE